MTNNSTIYKKVLGVIVLSLLINAFLPSTQSAKASLSTAQQNFVASGQLNNVMSDSDFININSLSPEQIQGYLVYYNSYLQNFVDSDGRSAAQIIYDAAHSNYHFMSDGMLNNINVSANTTGGRSAQR